MEDGTERKKGLYPKDMTSNHEGRPISNCTRKRERGVKRMTSPLNETSIRPRKAIKKLRELMIEQ